MADFVDPFIGKASERKLTKRELIRAIRLALSAEEEAIHLYEALADSSPDALAREVLQDIANEERVHQGEFLRLIEILEPSEIDLKNEGADEVDVMAREVDNSVKTKEEKGSVEKKIPVLTVGSLKERKEN